MPRFFRIEQAERLLPLVRAAVEEAVGLHREQEECGRQMQAAMQRIASVGGAMPDRNRFAETRERRAAAARALDACIERIHSFGCQVKDLELGLIDFPARFRGREVLLCWKLGESAIEWWHDVDAGFRGRQPVDAEFLAGHEGDS